MCWEIRQHYLPAQAPGRFLLKGEGDWSGVAGAPQFCSQQGFSSNVSLPSALPVFYVLGP